MMNIIARNFLRLLRAGAFGKEEPIEPMSAWKWKQVYRLSLLHQVPAVVNEGIGLCRNQFFMQLPEPLADAWAHTAQKTAEEGVQIENQLLDVLEVYNGLHVRPILIGGLVFAQNYGQSTMRSTTAIKILLPFATQGKKADNWAMANGQHIETPQKQVLKYTWNGGTVENHHKLMLMTNRMHGRTLQNIVEQELRETSPCYVSIKSRQVETLSPTLTLLSLLLRITTGIMNEGTQQRWLVDLGLYLRKAGHLVDYVKLQDWLKRLGMERMARHIGMLLAGSLHLSHDEIPFMSSDEGPYAEPTTHDLFQYHPANKNQWYFQQQEHDIFVSTTNSSAMFRQARRSAKYFTYYPSESITNFLTSFSHSLSHIEE